MRKANLWKAIIAAALLVASIILLVPTFRLQMLSEAERANMNKEELNRLSKSAIHLGLDLKGGMHLVLEVDEDGLAKAKKKDVKDVTSKELSDATDRAIEIIRNRVDQYGVAEPLIQKQGDKRIVVQLPGVDQTRARNLIGATALLEFKLVQDEKVTQQVFDQIDRALGGTGTASDTALLSNKPFTSLLQFVPGEVVVNDTEREQVEQAIRNPVVAAALPPEYELVLGKRIERDNERTSINGYPLYLLKKQPEITGAAIQDARMQVSQSAENPGGVEVAFTLVKNPYARIFSRVTAANKNRRLAIVLDGWVVSAPVIQSQIPDGSGVITMGGDNDPDQAKDLAIILRAGALPAPMKEVEVRSVGPTLGQDSINNGIKATFIGCLAVVLFMVIYYSLGGLIANVALLLNMVMLLATMAAFRFTLTLPGIAGVALTVGMAVDTYVLIFERIREELATGKTIRAAIDAGYDKAFRTILDSNATVFFAAIALLLFGTGPIKGFAVSLIVGLLVSMFTAVVVTRMIFDWITFRWKVTKLYI